MCTDCNKKDCCCEEHRIDSKGVKGDKGDRGLPGASAFVYIGYATNVTPGTPDTVIGFSTTVPGCWMAIKTSIVPISPITSTFQGLWKKVCGDSTFNAYLFSKTSPEIFISNGTSNLNTDIVVASVTCVTTGKYIIQGTLTEAMVSYVAADNTAGNLRLKIKKNTTVTSSAIASINNLVMDYEVSMSGFDVLDLVAGDVVRLVIAFETDEITEQVTISAPAQAKLFGQMISL